MREKLIEFVHDARMNALWHNAPNQSEYMTDMLIANGVTIPVLCKDCKHGIWNEEEQMWQCVYSAELDEGIGEYFGFFEYNEGEHFCSRGERKTDETD